MPSLGADMDSGTLLEWLVKPGESVARGDIVAVVDTDKATVEIEIFEDGIVAELVVPEGREVPVGTLLARITSAGETPSPPVPPSEPAVPDPPTAETRPPAPTPSSHVTSSHVTSNHVTSNHVTSNHATSNHVTSNHATSNHATTQPARAGRVRATPLARRIARERGIDLSSVEGTGPHGAVTRQDVDADAPTAARPVPRAERQQAARPLRPGMRGTIAAAMQRSKREIPHYYLETRIDLMPALTWLEEQNRSRPITERLLPGALLNKAVALAARRVPEMNGYWEDDEFRPASSVHLAIAVSLRQGGLVAPALRDADELSLDDLMRTMRDLVNRARKGRLRSSELGTATLTVTSLGDRGVEKVYGVIHPPQVALVGFGRIVEEPWAERGMLAARPVVTATLSADHRASDGYRGARFLAEIRALLETPEAL